MVRAFVGFWTDPSYSFLVDGELSAFYFAHAVDFLLDSRSENTAQCQARFGMIIKKMSDKGGP